MGFALGVETIGLTAVRFQVRGGENPMRAQSRNSSECRVRAEGVMPSAIPDVSGRLARMPNHKRWRGPIKRGIAVAYCDRFCGDLCIYTQIQTANSIIRATSGGYTTIRISASIELGGCSHHWRRLGRGRDDTAQTSHVFR